MMSKKLVSVQPIIDKLRRRIQTLVKDHADIAYTNTVFFIE
jgi:hypothetical protein